MKSNAPKTSIKTDKLDISRGIRSDYKSREYKRKASNFMLWLYIAALGAKFSGRMGGSVFNANGTGRGFTKPRLTRTTYTSAVRSSFTFWTQKWNALPLANVAAWNLFSYPKSDRVGEGKAIKGKSAFVGINQNLAQIGISAGILTPAPFAGVSVPTFGGLILDTTTSSFTLSYPTAFGALPGRTAVVLSATDAKATGISRPGSSQFRNVVVLTAADFTISGGAYTSRNLHTDIINRVGGYPIGSKGFIGLLAVDNLTGQAATKQTLNNVAV